MLLPALLDALERWSILYLEQKFSVMYRKDVLIHEEDNTLLRKVPYFYCGEFVRYLEV